MKKYSQGDVIRIAGFKNRFLIVSNNNFINYTGTFHVCPLLEKCAEGPLHIAVHGLKGTEGVAVCEQIKLIDPDARACMPVDRLPYTEIMDISDALQGMLEYD